MEASLNASFFDMLLGNKPLPNAWLILEQWLRKLRDTAGKDYYQWFRVGIEDFYDVDEKRWVRRWVIRFSHPAMDMAGRERMGEILNPILNEKPELGIGRLGPSVYTYWPWSIGCEAAFQIRRPDLWNKPALSPEDEKQLLKILLAYGNAIGRKFHQRMVSPDQDEPLEWKARPIAYLRGVWVSLTPSFGRKYPTLELPGDVESEVNIIQKELLEDFSGERFSLVRLAQVARTVWILFDYDKKETSDSGKQL